MGHASDLEGRDHLRPGQRAGQGVLRDRGPRRAAAPGARQGRRPDPLPAALRGRAARSSSTSTSTRRTTTASTTVVLTEDDLASLPAERSREIEVVEFVPSDQIDPIMLDRSYFLEPDSKSPKAYVLLRRTLEETDRTAIVQFSLRQKTRLGALRVRGEVLMLQTLLWDDEVREADFPALDDRRTRSRRRSSRCRASLVDSFVGRLRARASSPTSTRSSCAARSRRSSSRATRSTPPRPSARRPKEAEDAEVIDLMEALRRSVERNRAGRSGSESAKRVLGPRRRRPRSRPPRRQPRRRPRPRRRRQEERRPKKKAS